MDCREKIVSEDYLNLLVDYIADFDLLKQNGVDYCFVPIEENFGILYVSRTNLLPLSASEYRYAFVPKCYGLAAREETSGLFSTIKQSENAVYGEYRLQQEGQRLAGAYEDSGILRVQQPPLSLTGNGILIGLIDTGIRYTFPDFLKEDGTTKLHSVWDQTQQSGQTPIGLPYGTVFSKEEINENLRQRENAQSVPLLLTDENGHGTKVASVASKAAPSAELIMVKCRQAKSYLRTYYRIPEAADAYDESDIVAALKYIHDISQQENKPVVIGITMGTNMGDHTGNSFLNRYLNTLTQERHHCIVIGGGNEGNAAHHYAGGIMLQAENLIDIFPRKGMRITPFTEKNIDDLYQTRKLIEPTVCRKYLTMYSKNKLLEFQKQFEKAENGPDFDEFKIDTSFHSYLIDITENSILINMYHSVMVQQMRLAMYAALKDDRNRVGNLEQHRAIIDALLRENGEDVQDAIILHINHSLIKSLKMIKNED